MGRTTAPYGAWPSPLSASRAASGSLRLSDPQLAGDSVYWVEGRPAEDGRCAVVRLRAGKTTDVVPQPFSARNTVHEYGGGSLRVSSDQVFFTNLSDRRVYRVDGGAPVPVSPELGDVRFADLVIDPARNRLVSVVEDHRGAGVVNDIRALHLDDGTLTTLVAGNDFYAYPRLSPDGSQLAWITWNQPNMPWDGSELWIAELDANGGVVRSRLVAGGVRESIFQPSWSPAGVLHFCSDRTGFWNMYRATDSGVSPVAPIDADCGEPLWVFGLSSYAFCDESRIAFIASEQGVWRMYLLSDSSQSAPTPLELPFTAMRQLSASGDDLVMLAGGPRHTRSVVRVDARSGAFEVLRASDDHAVDESVLAVAEPIRFAGAFGAEAHAFFYPPRNDSVDAPNGELPPLYVRAHGGPTSATDTSLNESIQFWTSRGFAVVDVNYGGSSGYGRKYRDRLYGQEGVVDVLDCIAAARHLAEHGLVDGERMTIAGGSAGGYIVLCAMTFHDCFASGADHYGIADWETMLGGTHKFEERYFDLMIGPYPERRDLFYERSPIHYADRVRRPMIIFQGLEDRIVPPDQSQVIFDALRERGIPCAYLAFEGEQHGFRKQRSIERALEAELAFHSRALHITPSESLPPLEIENAERF